SGGTTQGYSWSLASGALTPLTLSTGGLVSGTPSAAGTLTFTLKIADSSGASAQQPCAIVISNPITISQATVSANQTTLTAGFTQPAPAAFTGTMTLTFTPNTNVFSGAKALPQGYVDPAAGFPAGGQCASKFSCNFSIAQGSSQSTLQFSQGTVAG